MGTFFLLPGYRYYRNLSEQRLQLEQKNLSQKENLKEIRLKQTRFKEDPEFVEQIARRNRRIRPGEVLFIFDEHTE